MERSYEKEENASDVADFSPDQQFWWQQIEEKIEQSIAEYTETLWERLQEDASARVFQQKFHQDHIEGNSELQFSPEAGKQLLDYFEQQKSMLHGQFDQCIEQGKDHLKDELRKLREELWQDNQQKINSMIQPSYQLISRKLGQNRLHLEREWQSQRQQLEQRQTQLLKDLEGQIHQRLQPIIKHLEQELQYSYNLRERIRSVLSQFEGLIKNRTQKAWQKIDDLVKKQQESWSRHNQQLSTKLQHWGEKWTAEEGRQRQLLEKSHEFARKLEQNISLYQQQIQGPRQAFLLEGKKIISLEIRQLIKQFRLLGAGQEERIKVGVSRLLEKWRKLVEESNVTQQHFAQCLLEAHQNLKAQQNKILSIKSLQEKEAGRFSEMKEQLFANIGRVNGEIQQQLVDLRMVTDRGLQHIEQLMAERLQLVDEQLRSAESDDLARLDALDATIDERIASLREGLEQRVQQQQQKFVSWTEQKNEQLSTEVQQQFDQKIGQLQRRLHQRQETLESEQRQLQGELQSRLQKDCLRQLDEHREYLRSEFTVIEQNCQGRIEQFQALVQEVKQQYVYDKEKLVSKYKVDYNGLKDWFEHSVQQLQAKIEGYDGKFKSGYEDALEAQQRQGEELGDLFGDLKERSEAVGSEIGEKLNAVQQEVEERVAGFSQHLDDELLRFGNKLQQCSREATNELRAEQKELQNRVREVHERIELQRKGMLQQVSDSVSLLDQQIGDIERRQQDYLGNHVLLERAEQMRRELLDGIDYLRKEGELVGRIRLQVNDVKEDLGRNNRLSEEIASRLKNLQQKEVDLNQIEAKLQQIFKLSDSWEQRWQGVRDSQQQLEDFQQRFQGLEMLHQQAAELVRELQDDAEKFQQERRGAEQQKVLVREVEEKISDLRRKVVPLESNFRRLNALENSIGQQQTAVEALVLRAESLQATLDGIDQRMEKVYQARDFIGRTETRIEELGEQLKGQVQALEKVSEQPKGGEHRAPDVDTRNTVIQLFQKGWTKKEIARATRLSVGAIELILELAPRK